MHLKEGKHGQNLKQNHGHAPRSKKKKSSILFIEDKDTKPFFLPSW